MTPLQLTPVILCGGSGTRLWPLSRKHHPKQFVPLFDQASTDTLFRRVLDRVVLFNVPRTIIVCNHAHRFLVAGSLNDAEREKCSVLVEPEQRNTAPAVTLAALQAMHEFGDALLLVMPSDHVIAAPDAFTDAVTAAVSVAQQNQIVVFGITPDRAESNYGYIHVDDKQATSLGISHKVVEFCEKPEQEVAAEWIARGNCYWNSGIFLMKASVYLAAIDRFEPGMRQACEQAYTKRYEDLGFVHVDADWFAKCRNISIDYAVMERTDNIMLVPTDMGWSDLGDWNSLSTEFQEMPNGNRVRGDVVLKEATQNIVYSSEKLVSVLGVDNCVVVDTPDALLVASRAHAGNIKNLIADIQHRPEADTPHKVFRPWGYYERLNKSDYFQVKRLLINPGHSLSLQMHYHRSEHWVVVKGEARVTRGDETFTIEPNQSTYIPAQVRHRLENVGTEPVQIIEVQCGDYLEEDDIVRFDDRYGRTEAKPT